MIISIVIVSVILIDALFYGFGSAVRNLNFSDLEKEYEESHSKKIERLMYFNDFPKIFVNTVQLISIILHMLAAKYFLNEIWQLALAIYLILSLGILLPKSIAKKKPEKCAFFFVNIMYVIVKILSPFTWIIYITVELLLNVTGYNSLEELSDVTEEEILSMVNEGHEQGVIQASEAEMITNIFEYGDKEAQDIMTHRGDIVALDENLSLNEAISFMLKARNSRFPVYHENIDHIIGILHLKDALRLHAQNVDADKKIKDIEGLLREAVFIPETKNLDVLFKRMQSLKLQMVIVIDEYGQTMGLVAMEDILEEIVGNILDEYDEEVDYLKQICNDEYITDGKTLLKDLEDRLHMKFPDTEFETLNGFLIGQMDRIPKEKENFEVDCSGYHFKVMSVKNRMIYKVRITKLKESSLEEESK